MYPVTVKSNSRPNERRRNPRLRSSSLIYVQVGSDNGGIVTNLGLDGVAFQAARQLTEESSSTLNLRLRGSGIDANLIGELVWLGITKKEAGIRFKEIPTEVHQGIADWILREAQGSEARPPMDRFPPKPMAAMDDASAARDKSVSHSLSAALAMSRAAIAKLTPAPVQNVDTKPPVEAPLETSAVIPAAPLEIVSQAEHNSPTTIPPAAAAQLQAIESDLPPVQMDVGQPEQSEAEQDLPDEATASAKDPSLPDAHPPAASLTAAPLAAAPPQIEQPFQAAAFESQPLAPFQAAGPISPEGRPQTFGEVRGGGNSLRLENKEKEAKPNVAASKPPVRSVRQNAADKWIPATLLAAWKRGNSKQKLVIAGMAAGCLWIIGLILVLSLTHVANPSSALAGSGAVQQSQASALGTVADSGSHQPIVRQAPRVRVASDSGQDGQPEATFWGKISDTLFGSSKPDLFTEPGYRPQINIDPNLVGVQVWTSKSSGYYYCADSPFYMTIQPGAVMNQRDALQTGYQPILGQFCE